MTNHQQSPIKIEDKEIEYIQEYVYLISRQNKQRNKQKNHNCLKKILVSKAHINFKRKVFDICVSSTLPYGCQSWGLTEKQENKIKIYQNKIERSIT